MSRQNRIVFLVGGAYHPTDVQAAAVIRWLGRDYACRTYNGVAAFEALDDADLLVLMGMHWTGMTHPLVGELAYRPMRALHQDAFERYVASGRPLLVHHAAICSYDDWPRFGELLGFIWSWTTTGHVPIGEFRVSIEPTGHPILAGVDDYSIVDELYCDVQITPGLSPVVHAVTYVPDEGHGRANGRDMVRAQPMVVTGEGGRVEGAGRVVYLANGHDMRAFACPALRQLWINAARWLLGDE